MAVSDTPWSNFSAADYTVEQWHRACIVHDHTGPATSKDQCKLPVREPDGTLNRNGVHAAQAALHGARGGVKLSFQDRIKALKALKGYYTQIGEKLPPPKKPAFLKHDDTIDAVNTSMVLVALPAADDPCQRIGAEEKHATLLFLGDVVSDEVAVLVQASIQQTVTRYWQSSFSEPVSGVDSLGPEGARVWMIDSGFELRSIRNSLLRIPIIKALFDSQEQFPNYTPHVTIDYPAAGASLLDDMVENAASAIKSIKFDRLALWHGDNHSVSWRFADSADLNLAEAAHSDVDTFLAHHGIKGQRWGVRRDRGSDGTVSGVHVSTSEHGFSIVKGSVTPAMEKTHLAATKSILKRAESVIPAVIEEHSHAPGNPKVDEAYFNKIEQDFISRLNTYAATLSNKQYKHTVEFGSLDDLVVKTEVYSPEVKHADSSGAVIQSVFKIVRNSNGILIGLVPSNTVSHSDVDAFLAHHGIKGMRWGVRRDRGSDGTVSGPGHPSGAHVKGGGDTPLVKVVVKQKSDGSYSVKGKGIDKLDAGATIHEPKTGSTLIKSHDGSWRDSNDKSAVDHERFLSVIAKRPDQISTADLKSANQRAEALKKYNELFGDVPHKDLQAQLQKLQLVNNIDQAKATYARNHPSPMTKLVRTISSTAKISYPIFTKFIKTTEGKKLADMIANELKGAFDMSAQPSKSSRTTSSAPKKQSTFQQQRPKTQRKARDGVYKITNLGDPNPTPGNPFIPALESRKK